MLHFWQEIPFIVHERSPGADLFKWLLNLTEKATKKNALNSDKVPRINVSNVNTYWKLLLKLIYCTNVEHVFFQMYTPYTRGLRHCNFYGAFTISDGHFLIPLVQNQNSKQRLSQGSTKIMHTDSLAGPCWVLHTSRSWKMPWRFSWKSWMHILYRL